MTSRSGLIKWLGILLFAFGVGIGLYLAGSLTWGEMETNRGSVPADSKSLKLSCPLMLSFDETATVQTQIVNELDEEVKPLVIANFGQPDTLEQVHISQAYILSPHGTQTLQWQVDSSNAAFGRVIPVVIYQSLYSLNPPRWGSCGILLFSLFGLNGSQTLIFIIVISVLFIGVGFFLARPYFTAYEGLAKNVAQMATLLAVLTLLSLISAVFRKWGLTILIETISAITIGTLITELIVPHHKAG